jgi:hypothetical protein
MIVDQSRWAGREIEGHMMKPWYANLRLPLLEAVFISVFILGLFYYWFGSSVCGGYLAWIGSCAVARKMGGRASSGSDMACR